MSEHDEQVALFKWAQWQSGKWPELRWMYAIPNGGARHVGVAAKLKAEGVKPGIPDICLPVPRGGFGALYIELKAKGGRVSQAQRAALDALVGLGNSGAVVFGWEQATKCIQAYLQAPLVPVATP